MTYLSIESMNIHTVVQRHCTSCSALGTGQAPARRDNVKVLILDGLVDFDAHLALVSRNFVDPNIHFDFPFA